MMDPFSRRIHRLAYFTPGWPSDVLPNGITAYTWHLVHSLRARGVDCRVLARKRRDDGDPRVYPIAPSAAGTTRARRVVRRLLRLPIRRDALDRAMGAAIARRICRINAVAPIDLMQMEESFGWAAHVKQRVPIPVVVRLHGPWFLNGAAAGVPHDDAFEQRVEAERRSIAAADAVSAPSRDVICRTRARYGLELPTARVIPNPIEPVANSALWRLDAADQTRVLFIGRFDRHKGADIIVRAFAKVHAKMPQVKLTIVGPDTGVIGTDGHPVRSREYIVTHVASVSARAAMTFVGSLPRHELDAYRRAALVTVVCSRWENFANTATEALRLGCPVVMADVGGLSEMIRDGHSGLLHTPGDDEHLAAQLLRMLQHPRWAAQLGAAGAEDAKRRYAPDEVVSQTLSFYRSVVEKFLG